jgi:hypothetical protein
MRSLANLRRIRPQAWLGVSPGVQKSSTRITAEPPCPPREEHAACSRLLQPRRLIGRRRAEAIPTKGSHVTLSSRRRAFWLLRSHGFVRVAPYTGDRSGPRADGVCKSHESPASSRARSMDMLGCAANVHFHACCAPRMLLEYSTPSGPTRATACGGITTVMTSRADAVAFGPTPIEDSAHAALTASTSGGTVAMRARVHRAGQDKLLPSAAESARRGFRPVEASAVERP